MKALIISILVIFTFSISQAATPIVKYVWAPNGLNLRQAPSTSSAVIAKLEYGDVITLLEETDETYHTVFIENQNNDEQLLLKHTWVKVIKEGIVGYIIDGYLLDFVTPSTDHLGEYNTTLRNSYSAKNILLSQADIAIDEYLLAIALPNEKSISVLNYSETEGDLYFENFTHQEILIFLNKFLGLENNSLSGFGINYAEEKNIYFEMLNIEIKDQGKGITKVEMYYEGC